MNTPIHLEANDATAEAIAAIQATGGSITSTYRTPLTMRQYLKPHKFQEWQNLKNPMPSPKVVKNLEKVKAKGIEITYPDAPWFTSNQEELKKEKEERERRIATAQHADLLPQMPADRSEGVGLEIPRVQRKQLWKNTKYV